MRRLGYRRAESPPAMAQPAARRLVEHGQGRAERVRHVTIGEWESPERAEPIEREGTRGYSPFRRRQTVAPYLEAAALCALIALSLGLRVVNLGALPIFFDESEYVHSAAIVGAASDPSSWLASLHYGVPPLFSWLAAPLTRVVPDTLLAARLTSAVIGALTLLATWATARLLSGRAVGLVAAAIFALCPFAVFYNRMGMLDGLVAACGAGALLFALRLSRQGRRVDAVALGLFLAAGLLTKIFAFALLLLPLLAVIAALPEQRRNVRRGALLAATIAVGSYVGLLLLPQSTSLLALAQQHSHPSGSVAAVVGGQLAAWAAALWLYITPPVIVLALVGLWVDRRQHATLLIGPWAVLGSLPPVLLPQPYLAPRYVLYIAVPIAVLAARGVVAVATTLTVSAPRRIRPALGWALLFPLTALTVGPAAGADTAIVSAPARAPLTAFDRWQYITGWPSGYAFMRTVAYLRGQERDGNLTVVSSILNPPGDALAVVLGHDRHARLLTIDFAMLSGYAQQLAPGARVYLIACHPYGQPLPHAADRHALRLVLSVPNGDGNGGDDVYRVTRL